MKATAFTLWLVVFGTICFGQTFEGTIGKYPIYLRLSEYNRHWQGEYFYLSSLKSIALKGKFFKDELQLSSDNTWTGEEQEWLDLIWEDSTLVKGLWHQGDVRLPVRLKRCDVELDAYRKNQLTFIRDSVQRYGEKELVWINEKWTGQRLFRLGNGFTAEQRKFFNPYLDRMQRENAMEDLQCSEADHRYQVELVSERFVSFSNYHGGYCGGAHPYYGTTSTTFDLEHLSTVKAFTDLYPNLDAFQLLKEKYQNDESLESECGYFKSPDEDYNYTWTSADWVLTSEGLQLIPYFPHVMAPCRVSFLLTYEEINRGTSPKD